MTFYDRYQQLCVEAGSSATGVAVSVGISRASFICYYVGVKKRFYTCSLSRSLTV